MKRLSEYIINLFKKKNEANDTHIIKALTKKISWLLGIAGLGVLLIVMGSIGSTPKTMPDNQVKPSEKEMNADSGKIGQSNMTKEEALLANKICQMLSHIRGAGDVEVSVRLQTSSRSEYAINTVTGQKTTQEKDQGGGTRLLTETTDNGQLVLIRGTDGTEIPVVERESAPKIAGVLVVAQGADNPQIKARLFEATCVALGVEAHRVQVMPKKEGE